MPRTDATSPISRRGHVLYYLVLLLLAGGVFAGLATYLKTLERRAVRGVGVRERMTFGGQPRPLAQVTSALRQVKLVTVEVTARVKSEVGDESWRGDVRATVEAPVRLLYGTDLSEMTTERMALSPASGGLFVRIPPPERIATEVCGDAEDIDVRVGWMRLRSMAGEYYLGVARRDLYQRAREITLSPDDARMVRQATREQTEAVIRKVVGPGIPITVAFEDGLP